MKKELPFRQVHLDFHTSEEIKDIGKNFSKEQFQNMLKTGHINSITVFSKCHHGWAYHPSRANEIHPHLDFDLLGMQIEAAHEIGIKTPVYISAGLDEKMARRHPEWLIRDEEDKTRWISDFMTPGYHQFCFNTPYLDYLLEQIKEVLLNYDADGIFLDIVGLRSCYCQYCVKEIRKQGKDPRDTCAMQKMWENTYKNYTEKVQALIDEYKPQTLVFHNGGHIKRGRRDLAHMNSHLEIESLPTGGWGYQHFPLSARYAQGLGMECLGMTGKFHNTWGEFGGYKHPNALRYETALNIANGAKCSIGDQLHPEGLMDYATYKLIGEAYGEIEEKEEWCNDVISIADIAMLSTEALISMDNSHKGSVNDSGCVKMLLEGKCLFDVIDLENNFSKYKVIILPDIIRIDGKLSILLNEFINNGGKILATGTSGLDNEDSFALDFGVQYLKESTYSPSYFMPNFKPKSLEITSFVMYSTGQDVKLTTGHELGEYQNSYFNRDVFTFCSHQHTPSTLKRYSPGMAEGTAGIYIAWEVFSEYDKYGSLILKEMVLYAIDKLLGDNKTLSTNLPAQGVATLMYQKDKHRYVQHVLYASPVKRGEHFGKPIEIIEDIIPILDTSINLKVMEKVTKVYLAPQMKELNFEQENGIVSYKIDKFECHQMVVLEF